MQREDFPTVRAANFSSQDISAVILLDNMLSTLVFAHLFLQLFRNHRRMLSFDKTELVFDISSIKLISQNPSDIVCFERIPPKK